MSLYKHSLNLYILGYQNDRPGDGWYVYEPRSYLIQSLNSSTFVVLVDKYCRCPRPTLWIILPTRMYVTHSHASIIYLTGAISAFAPYLLEKKAEKIRKTADLEKGPYKSVRTVFDIDDRSWVFVFLLFSPIVYLILIIYTPSVVSRWKSIFAKALTRPFQLFVQEPIIQILGIYMAFIYGLFYSMSFIPRVLFALCLLRGVFPSVFLTIIPNIFADVYNEAPGIAGLHYIALGVGLSTASQLNARFLDRIYIYFKNKKGGVGEPEFRLRELYYIMFALRWYWFTTNFPATMVPASIVLPIGLILAGWAAQGHLPWIATDIVRLIFITVF